LLICGHLRHLRMMLYQNGPGAGVAKRRPRGAGEIKSFFASFFSKKEVLS
jgi:hypothetical protein